jgi:hypothetical protein
LAPDDYHLWLDTDLKTPASLKPPLKPYPSGEMVAFPVSGRVNKPTYDALDCIEEATGAKECCTLATANFADRVRIGIPTTEKSLSIAA